MRGYEQGFRVVEQGEGYKVATLKVRGLAGGAASKQHQSTSQRATLVMWYLEYACMHPFRELKYAPNAYMCRGDR